MYLEIMAAIHIPMLAVGIVFLSFLIVRSNRTPLYYALFWYSLCLIALLAARIIEIIYLGSEFQLLFNQLGLLLSALLVPFVINLIYALVIRHSMPFVMQMISGAAVLALIMFIMPYADLIGRQSLYSTLPVLFLVYIWIPALAITLSVPLVSIALSRNLINISSLSFERILAHCPDLYFFINAHGTIADHNCSLSDSEQCIYRSDLLKLIEKFWQKDSNSNLQKLRSAMLLPQESSSGEIKLDMPEPGRWYYWKLKPVYKRRHSYLGSFLLLSDRTSIKRYMQILSEQNESLQKIHAELADYENLAERYTEIATRQEVADYIDNSVRNRLTQSFEQMIQLRYKDETASSRVAISYLQAECRNALADVRSLVKKLSQ